MRQFCPPQSAIRMQFAPSPLCTRCVHHDRSSPPASKRELQLAPHRVPCARPSAGRASIQPEDRIYRHVQSHGHERHVRGARPPVRPLCPQICAESRPPPPCPACDPSGTQGASAFNQPIKFDTKSVTDMSDMFEVRASPRPRPPTQSAVAPSPLCTRCRPAASTPRGHPPPPASRPAALPAPRVPCARPARQDAHNFNQKIEFTDTSQVTDMADMFSVRFSPRPGCPPQSAVASCPLCTHCSTPHPRPPGQHTARPAHCVRPFWHRARRPSTRRSNSTRPASRT